VGNYAASVFGTTGRLNKQSGWNDARLVTIIGEGAMTAVVGTDYTLYGWKTLSYPVVLADRTDAQKDATYAEATYYPAATATGPFYFGLGLTGRNAQNPLTYYIKDVALVKADGTTKLLADDLDLPFGNTNLGQLNCQFSGVTITRTMEPEPTAP
jgi:hypothetical protein